MPLTEAFATDSIKDRQWRGFIRKSRLIDIPEDFVEIIEGISTFLGPVAKGLSSGQAFSGVWKSPGPWSS